jgi:hypothetical protein
MMIATSLTTSPQLLPESFPRPRELGADELRFSVKITQKFASTQELTGAKEFVG